MYGNGYMNIKHLKKYPCIDYIVRRAPDGYSLFDKDGNVSSLSQGTLRNLVKQSTSKKMKVRLLTSGLSRAQTGRISAIIREDTGVTPNSGTVIRTVDGKAHVAGFYLIIDWKDYDTE